MQRLIIRFRNKPDLDNFTNLFGITYHTNLKTLYLPSGMVKKYSKKNNLVPNDNLSEFFPEAQINDFYSDKEWTQYWKDMPRFEQDDNEAYAMFEVMVEDEYLEEFQKLMNQKVTKQTKSIWHPKLVRGEWVFKRYVSNDRTPNKYQIYIPSKGRHDCCLTADHLMRSGIDNFLIIVEEQQYEDYKKFWPEKNLIILDKTFQDNYKTLDDLGYTKSKGPGAARNFAWARSKALGEYAHWVMDDNIRGFYRFGDNQRITVRSPASIKACEEFFDRFKNVGMAGMNYRMFCAPNSHYPPYAKNTRIYSCNLIRNDVPFEWRGRYNEDTILSLDMLEAKWATIQYNAFLCNKLATQTLKGGNTEEFYAKDGTYAKSKMLVDEYPEVTELVKKYDRWHHYVDYSKYKSIPLLYKDDYIPKTNIVNEMGMYLIDVDAGEETNGPEDHIDFILNKYGKQ